jgi:glycogen debranching enzyme
VPQQALKHSDSDLRSAAPANKSVPEVEFYIPATNLPSRPRYTIKHGGTFLVMDSHGDIGAASGGADGLFHDDTRYMSQLELRFDGETPLLLGSNVRDDNSALSADLTNPDIFRNGQVVLQKDTVHIVRTTFVWRKTAYQRIAVKNHGDHALDCELSLQFANDFADIFEVRGLARTRRGVAQQPEVQPDAVLLNYEGLDESVRRTKIVFDPAPLTIEQHVARYRLNLEPHQSAAIFVALICNPEREQPRNFFKALLASRRESRAGTQNMATVQTSNDIFNEVLCRSMADLNMLMTQTPDGRFPYAGIPWYSTTFGRDSLITAQEMLWLDPTVARGVLRRLARLQATKNDEQADAQPGKILHEMRAGEMAALHEVPFGLYYGSVDSTPLFVMLAGLYVQRTGDVATLKELWPAIEAGLAWMDGPGDPDGDGFLEYHRANEKGLVNQGWKDSFDSIFHADGSLAQGPIALAEVQGYAYAAKHLAAHCARLLKLDERAAALESQARALARRFEDMFWCPEIGTYALALDGSKNPCRVRTSNAGQLLFTGIASPERAAAITEQLLRPDFFSGWGIRTVATGEARYNPMSYHNGSIWPHDNALIALGFARYGNRAAAGRILEAMFAAASYMDLRRLPELYCGFPRRRGRGPTLYPVACAPQAWAAGTPFLLVQATLGLTFDPSRNEVCLQNPYVPSFLDHLLLRNVGLCGASADLLVHRDGDAVSVEVIRAEGEIRVSVVYDYSRTKLA